MKSRVLSCLIAAVVAGGCATKKFVAREVGAVNEKADALGAQVEATQDRVGGLTGGGSGFTSGGVPIGPSGGGTGRSSGIGTWGVFSGAAGFCSGSRGLGCVMQASTATINPAPRTPNP